MATAAAISIVHNGYSTPSRIGLPLIPPHLAKLHAIGLAHTTIATADVFPPHSVVARERPFVAKLIRERALMQYLVTCDVYDAVWEELMPEEWKVADREMFLADLN